MENALLQRYISAAREYSEEMIYYKLCKQRWVVSFDGFSKNLHLEIAPMISVDSVQYYDEDDALQTLPTTVYQVNDYLVNSVISLKANQSWPTTKEAMVNSVLVNCTVGIKQPKHTHKHAILLIAAAWYKNREDFVALDLKPIPHGAKALLGLYENQVFA